MCSVDVLIIGWKSVVGGSESPISCWNNTNARRLVIPRDTFSPDSVGNIKTIKFIKDKSTLGNITLRTWNIGRRFKRTRISISEKGSTQHSRSSLCSRSSCSSQTPFSTNSTRSFSVWYIWRSNLLTSYDQEPNRSSQCWVSKGKNRASMRHDVNRITGVIQVTLPSGVTVAVTSLMCSKSLSTLHY